DSSQVFWRTRADALGHPHRFEYGDNGGVLWLEIAGDETLGGVRLAARLELQRLQNWQARLTGSFLKEPAVASLRRWLSGLEPLSAPAAMSARMTFPSMGALNLGRGMIETASDWSLGFSGDRIVNGSLRGGLTFVADAATVHFSANTDSSIPTD